MANPGPSGVALPAGIRRGLLVALLAAPPLAMLFVEPIPQDPAYHFFADRRTLLGIANFWNVISNLAFIAVGIAGVVVLGKRSAAELHPDLRALYPLLFATLVVTGAGSALYHLAPSNGSLVWDRIGITLTIAALTSLVIGEHLSLRWGRRLLLPLIAAGIASVAWWAWTESRMAGDLRPYALFQFMPMALIALILSAYPSIYDRTGFMWWVIALYACAKAFEMLDQAIFSATGILSGHPLKHVVAASAMLVYLYGVTSRRLRR